MDTTNGSSSSTALEPTDVPSVAPYQYCSVNTYTLEDIELENFELLSCTLELLNTHDLWDDDGTYTFANGERWARFNPDEGE